MAVIERIRDATNEHDLEALVAVFEPAVTSETPAHPQRTFQGADQVRGTGSRYSRACPTSTPSLSTAVVDGDTVWSSRMAWHETRRQSTSDTAVSRSSG